MGLLQRQASRRVLESARVLVARRSTGRDRSSERRLQSGAFARCLGRSNAGRVCDFSGEACPPKKLSSLTSQLDQSWGQRQHQQILSLEVVVLKGVRSVLLSRSTNPVIIHLVLIASLGFCSLHSHCDSVFQQSDQLSGTVSAGCHRSNMLPYTGLPQCDEHVQEGWVRKELRSKPFVGAHFRGCKFSTRGCKFSTCTCLQQDEILLPQREVGRGTLNCGCKFSTC